MFEVMINLAFTNFDITDLTCITFFKLYKGKQFLLFYFLLQMAKSNEFL